MKTRLVYVLLLLALITSCKKDKKDKIEYPESGNFGKNILSLLDSDTLTVSGLYSFAAKLEADANLKIVITNLYSVVGGGPSAMWFYSDDDGWNIRDYTGDHQEFFPYRTGTVDMKIYFEAPPGKCRIDFYENSDDVTATKYLFW